MDYRYATKIENCAKAVGKALPISTKHAIEICNMIRGKKVDDALKMMQDVIERRRAVPMKRFAKGGTGHRKKIGPGRYPENACREIITVLKSAAANAQVKGLSSLVVTALCPQRAAISMHYGRKRRRKMKRTHVEIVLTQLKEAEKKPGKQEGARK